METIKITVDASEAIKALAEFEAALERVQVALNGLTAKAEPTTRLHARMETVEGNRAGTDTDILGSLGQQNRSIAEAEARAEARARLSELERMTTIQANQNHMVREASERNLR